MSKQFFSKTFSGLAVISDGQALTIQDSNGNYLMDIDINTGLNINGNVLIYDDLSIIGDLIADNIVITNAVANNLQLNELAISPTVMIDNVALYAGTDKNLYAKDDAGVITPLTGAGAGNVVGPISSTDNAVVRFDTVTGKLIQNSAVIIDDGGNLSTAGTLSFSAISGGLPTGLGDVIGPASSVDNTLPRYDSTTGKVIQNSGVIIDDSDNITTTGTLSFSAISGGLPTGLGDVVGPASSVDNTLPRYDSTTGKLIQNSGVIIDDSDNITTTGTLSFSAISGGLPTGLGDVVGPVSSTDNAVARYDSTTGKLIQDSDVTVDDSGNISTAGTLSFSAISGGLPTGLGDVVGPASATDNAVARYDTTTGKLIQNSAVTVDDSGNISTAGTASFSAISGGLPTGLGDVVGPASSVDNTLPRYDSTTGKLIQNSGVIIDDSDNITTTGTLSFSAISGGLPTGLGDVVGPASATDNAVARYDSTTGKLVQNSAVTVDDSGNISTAGTLSFSAISGGLPAGLGDVVGPASATDNAVVRYNSTTGKLVQNSVITITDGGSINKSGFPFIINANGVTNLGVGRDAAALVTGAGLYNTAVGYLAGESITTGDRNTYMGSFAGTNTVDGISNTGIGRSALAAVTSGQANVALGVTAGSQITTGDSNVCIGTSAGINYTTEDNNVCIENPGDVNDSAVVRIGEVGTHTTFLAGYKTQAGPTFDGGDTLTLTPQDSGSIYYILQRTSNSQCDLFASNNIGCHFNFYVGFRNADAVTVTFSAPSTDLYGTIIDPGGVTQINGSTNLIFGTTAGVGDSVMFHAYDSSVWFVKAITSTTGAITVS